MTEAGWTPRERLVHSAVKHLRRHGVEGMGLRPVVSDADAPWGSLHHYFPDGKDQLVAEALEWSGRFAADQAADYARSARSPDPAGLFDHIVRWWAADLRRRDYALGCPVAATVADGLPGARVRRATTEALDDWRSAIRDALLGMGVPARRARDLSTLMLASLEGAILLARAERRTAPLDTVRRQLRPVLLAATCEGGPNA